GGRFIDGVVRCSAVSTARSRAATMIDLARASLALVLRAVFGGAKSCAIVNVFMICPNGRLVVSRTRPNSVPDHGHLMARLTAPIRYRRPRKPAVKPRGGIKSPHASHLLLRRSSGHAKGGASRYRLGGLASSYE